MQVLLRAASCTKWMAIVATRSCCLLPNLISAYTTRRCRRQAARPQYNTELQPSMLWKSKSNSHYCCYWISNRTYLNHRHLNVLWFNVQWMNHPQQMFNLYYLLLCYSMLCCYASSPPLLHASYQLFCKFFHFSVFQCFIKIKSLRVFAHSCLVQIRYCRRERVPIRVIAWNSRMWNPSISSSTRYGGSKWQRWKIPPTQTPRWRW